MDWLDCGFPEEAEEMLPSLVSDISQLAEEVGVSLIESPVAVQKAPALMSRWSEDCPPDTAVGWGTAKFAGSMVDVALWASRKKGESSSSYALSYIASPPVFVDFESFFQYFEPHVKMAARCQDEVEYFERIIYNRYTPEVVYSIMHKMKMSYFGENSPANPRVAKCGIQSEISYFESEMLKGFSTHIEIIEIENELYIFGFDLYASKAV